MFPLLDLLEKVPIAQGVSIKIGPNSVASFLPVNVKTILMSTKNVLKKNKEKRQKYQQLTFEVRERRQRYRVEMIPIVIGCIGEGVGVMREQVRKILINSDADKVCREMLRTAVMEPKSIHSKVITNIVTGG